jgi:hypothetical protein
MSINFTVWQAQAIVFIVTRAAKKSCKEKLQNQSLRGTNKRNWDSKVPAYLCRAQPQPIG